MPDDEYMHDPRFYDNEPDDFDDELNETKFGPRKRKNIKHIAKVRAKRIASKRQFAIDQQNAKQDDIFGHKGEDADTILADVLSMRKSCSEISSSPTYDNHDLDVGDAGVNWLDPEWYKWDDLPF